MKINVIKATIVHLDSGWEVTYHFYHHPPIQDGIQHSLLRADGITACCYTEPTNDARNDAIERDVCAYLIGIYGWRNTVLELFRNGMIHREFGEHRLAVFNLPEVRENWYWRQADH
jgi:hypothetical protein